MLREERLPEIFLECLSTNKCITYQAEVFQGVTCRDGHGLLCDQCPAERFERRLLQKLWNHYRDVHDSHSEPLRFPAVYANFNPVLLEAETHFLQPFFYSRVDELICAKLDYIEL